MRLSQSNSPIGRATVASTPSEEPAPVVEKEVAPVPVVEETEVAADYAFTKSLDEERYTFGPLYTPGQLDAHDEFCTSEQLQKAVWNYARAGNRTIHKQHNRQFPIGEVVEQVAWPYPAEVELTVPGTGKVRKATLPAGTVYMGVVWEPEAWPLVKSGAISGYSLGGRALRVHGLEDATLTPMRKEASKDETAVDSETPS